VLKISNLKYYTTTLHNRLPLSLCLLFFVIAGFSCQSDTTNARSVNAAALMVSAPVTEPAPTVDARYLLGKFNPASHADFVTIGSPYTDRPGMMLRKETFQAFETMWKAAAKDGVVLKIISSTRTFDQQKDIWEGKWKRFEKDAPLPKNRALKILEYSSMPGSSRHHWGTDLDLNDLNNPTFEKGGKYEKVYAWLYQHAREYGFAQPYTAGRSAGYHEEKWHWSYTPLSKTFLERYKKNLRESDINGFKGAETASEIGIVQHYVLGISTECLPLTATPNTTTH
jgi:LAS superfamily LD-carboxypeptidase LdcB